MALHRYFISILKRICPLLILRLILGYLRIKTKTSFLKNGFENLTTVLYKVAKRKN